jgi:glycolate oxidase subunit GlcD
VGYTGGALPVRGGLVVAFTRMNRILSIDPRTMTAEVEPGVVTHDLARRCGELGLFYPPDPASLKTSTIGGNVAENAGGPRCYKYGVTGRYVQRLSGFLVDGSPFRFGALSLKDVAGYAVKDLLVGSEGTLAVITRISLRLLSLPRFRRLWRLDFPRLEEAADFLLAIARGGIAPSVLEFMDKSSLAAACAYLGQEIPPGTGASLLVEIDGEEWEVKARGSQLTELLQTQTLSGVQSAETEEEMDRLWQLRRAISPAISRLKPKKINEDVAVPPWMIPQTVNYFHERARELKVDLVLFGHFGDGNIHTNLMVDPADRDEMRRADSLLRDIFTHVLAIGGTLSGEHGIGISKKNFMSLQFSQNELDLMKRIKTAFDPQGRLNPGKIWV